VAQTDEVILMDDKTVNIIIKAIQSGDVQEAKNIFFGFVRSNSSTENIQSVF
jgi:hypothetical protein